MTQLETPKNLTRNVLIGMFAGVLFASLFYYSQEFISQQIFLFSEKYVFNLGGQIFKNLLFNCCSTRIFLLSFRYFIFI